MKLTGVSLTDVVGFISNILNIIIVAFSMYSPSEPLTQNYTELQIQHVEENAPESNKITINNYYIIYGDNKVTNHKD